MTVVKDIACKSRVSSFNQSQTEGTSLALFPPPPPLYPYCVIEYGGVDAGNLVQNTAGYIHDTKMHHELLNIQITSGCLREKFLEIKKSSEISALSLCSALGILSQPQDTRLVAVLLFMVYIFLYPSITYSW